MKLLPLLLSGLLFCCCSPKVTLNITESRSPLGPEEDFAVLYPWHELPDDAVELGSVRIGDTGFSTRCHLEHVIDLASGKSREWGGNALQIIEHEPPSRASTCHRITANILYIPDVAYRDFPLTREMQYMLLPHADPFDLALFEEGCAMIHFYRPRDPQGSMITYDITVGDEILTRCRNNYRETVKIRAEGETTFRAATESKTEITLDVQPGHHYYVRCGVSIGVMVGRPEMIRMDSYLGEKEYNQVIPKK